MERKDKIQFLKNLATGLISLDKLKEKEFTLELGMNDCKYFINDQPVDREKYWAQWDAYYKSRPNEKVTFDVNII